MQVARDKRGRWAAIAAGLWVRLEWLLSAAAAPLAMLVMRERGLMAGLQAAGVCVALLCFTLFELQHPQQWRLIWLGLRVRKGGPAARERIERALLDEGLRLPPERVRALFREALNARGLSPDRVHVVVAGNVDVARTRDVGPFHLVELTPATAAGPASLLRALFAHELAHVAHRDPLLKRVLCGALVPLCTLAAALSAGLIEGAEGAAAPLALAVALLASATLLPWAYATLQAVSFALELRADREAAWLCGGPGPVFELLDCLDEGGQPYRLQRPPRPRPPELVEHETTRLLEELLYLMPAHPPTYERRRRMLLHLQKRPPATGFANDAVPNLMAATAPLVAALALGALAFQLAGPERLRPLRHGSPRMARLLPGARVPHVALLDPGCPGPTDDPLCEQHVAAALEATLHPARHPGQGVAHEGASASRERRADPVRAENPTSARGPGQTPR